MSIIKIHSSTTITVTHSFVGFHHWPEAPAEVAYLRNKHRHLFGVEVSFGITEDRGVEFHIAKKLVGSIIRKLAESMTFERGATHSCEALCSLIGAQLIEEGYYPTKVSVSEDGECSSSVEFIYTDEEGNSIFPLSGQDQKRQLELFPR